MPRDINGSYSLPIDPYNTPVIGGVFTTGGLFSDLVDALNSPFPGYVPGGGGASSLDWRFVDDFGAIGDGTSHPLSESYGNLTAAQAIYPYATDLAQEKDYCALLTALYDAPGDPADIVTVILGHGKTYKWNETFSPTRPIHLIGENIGEANSTTAIEVDAATDNHGIVVSDSGADGSLFQGFNIRSTESRATGGFIVEYNPTTGLMLFLKGTNPVNTTDVYSQQSARGGMGSATNTFQLVGSQDPYGNTADAIEIDVEPDNFTLGEVVTGGTSGATANVTYTGHRCKALCITSKSTAFLVGETITGGTSAATATVLRFHDAPTNLDVYEINVLTGTIDGSGASVDDRYIFIKESCRAHGIIFNRRAYLQDVEVTTFNGHGIYVVSGADGYTGNCNLSRVDRCGVVNCGGGAIFSGADANVCSLTDFTAVNNFGYALVDRSFLGIHAQACHSSNNFCGSWNSVNNTARSSTWLQMYSEGGNTISPWHEPEQLVEGDTISIGGTTGLGTKAGGTKDGCIITAQSYRSNWMYKDISGGVTFYGGEDSLEGDACCTFMIGGNSGSERGVNVDFYYPWATETNGVPWTDLAQLGCRMRVWDTDGGPNMQFYMRKDKGLYLTASDAGTGADFRAIVDVDGSGTITSVTVLAKGEDYDPITTTITLNGAGSGTGAVLEPIVRYGQVVDVVILNGGSGYTKTYPIARAFSINQDRCKIYSTETGIHPRLAFDGPDTNHNAEIAPKGTGVVYVPIGNVPNYADDTAAAAGGVPVGGVYRNGSVLQIRVA